MSKQFQQAFADPKGALIKDGVGNAALCLARLGSATPNDTSGDGAVFNVADGNGFARGCILLNTSGRKYSAGTYGVIWLYIPILANGSAAGATSRWINLT